MIGYYFSYWTISLLLLVLIWQKYKTTQVYFPGLMVFVLAGFLSVFLASRYNALVLTFSDFYPGYPIPRMNEIYGFLICAGLGEEGFKFLACLFASLAICYLGKRKVRSLDILLGSILVGAIFALLENLIAYLPILDSFDMFRRSYMPVPIHMSMGAMHGITLIFWFRYMQRYEKLGIFVIPIAGCILFTGYLVTVLFHTLYDVFSIFISYFIEKLENQGILETIEHSMLPTELWAIPFILLMLVFVFYIWKYTNENEIIYPFEVFDE